MASTGSVSDLVASNGKADQVYPCILMSHLISYLSNASCDVWINLWNPDPPPGLLQVSGGATQMRPCKWTCSLCKCKHWFVLWCSVDLMYTKNLHVRLLFHCLSGRCYCTMSAALLVSLTFFFFLIPAQIPSLHQRCDNLITSDLEAGAKRETFSTSSTPRRTCCLCNIILALISFLLYLFIFPSHLSACEAFLWFPERRIHWNACPSARWLCLYLPVLSPSLHLPSSAGSPLCSLSNVTLFDTQGWGPGRICKAETRASETFALSFV